MAHQNPPFIDDFPRATALCLRLLSSPLARAKLGEIGSELAEDG